MNTEYKMCVKQWTKRHSHLTRPSFPLDRRQSQGLSGEYLPPWPQTESEVKDLTVEWSRDIWILAILHTTTSEDCSRTIQFKKIFKSQFKASSRGFNDAPNLTGC